MMILFVILFLGCAETGDDVGRRTLSMFNENEIENPEIIISRENTLIVKARSKHLMKNRNASLLTLSYLGAQRTLPNYNVMGVAKAALESTTRYLANSMGGNQIRVNAISAGPVKTLAASGVKSFKKMLSYNESRAPLKRNITSEEVGKQLHFLPLQKLSLIHI